MRGERIAWTDERIDDLVARIEQRFDQVDRRLDRLEDEMVAMRREVHQLTLMMATGFRTLAGLIVASSL
jgi:hypothetical protein